MRAERIQAGPRGDGVSRRIAPGEDMTAALGAYRVVVLHANPVGQPRLRLALPHGLVPVLAVLRLEPEGEDLPDRVVVQLSHVK